MLFSVQELLLFALAALVLVLTPGPNMVYCVSRSLTQGPRAGLVPDFGPGYRRRDAIAREARVGSLTAVATRLAEEWSSRGATPGQNPAYRPSTHFPENEQRSCPVGWCMRRPRGWG